MDECLTKQAIEEIKALRADIEKADRKIATLREAMNAARGAMLAGHFDRAREILADALANSEFAQGGQFSHE